MAETQRSIATLQTLLANNTVGAISPTDLRDLMETLVAGHGEMYVTTPAATTITDTGVFVDTAGTFALTGSVKNWDMDTNGQLRYIGAADRRVHIAASVSMVSASNNQVIHMRVAKNGTSLVSSQSQRKISTGSDIGSISMHVMTGMSTNDYLTIQVRNTSSTTTVTTTNANLFAMDTAK